MESGFLVAFFFLLYIVCKNHRFYARLRECLLTTGQFNAPFFVGICESFGALWLRNECRFLLLLLWD